MDGRRPAAAVAIRLAEIDLADPVCDIESSHDAQGLPYSRVRVLVRRHSRVLGVIDIETQGGALSGKEVRAAVEAQIGPQASAGDAAARSRDVEFAERRARALADAPAASVVLCTRGRPTQLPACLRALLLLRYPRFELLVVDNGEPSDGVELLVDEIATEVFGGWDRLPAGLGLRVIAEPRRGLSWARNTGIQHAIGDVVAFTDDDAEVDPYWLLELWRALSEVPGSGCSTGLVLPAELETQAQLWFEEFGGHSKGRSCTRQVIDPLDPQAQNALYPLPAFGAGVSMAFRRAVLQDIGGFDPALGAGTPSGGSEDTAVFSEVLLGGHALVFTPDAVVRHHHRPDLESLSKQLAGYGRGLTGYYTKMVIEHPRLALELLKLAPRAVHDVLAADSARNSPLSADFPRQLTRGQVRGMLKGPGAYLQGRRLCRQPGNASGTVDARPR